MENDMKRIFQLEYALLLLALLFTSGCNSDSNNSSISADALLKHPDKEQILILDVRTAQEYSDGHVPGAINIPHTELSDKLGQVIEHEHKPVVVYCHSGRRAAIAQTILADAGFKQLLHLEGDMVGWKAGNYPIEK